MLSQNLKDELEIELREVIVKLIESKDDLENCYYIPIRLRYFDSNLKILVGDPQYDTDHRGIWSYGDLCLDGISEEDIQDLINSLINDLEENLIIFIESETYNYRGFCASIRFIDSDKKYYLRILDLPIQDVIFEEDYKLLKNKFEEIVDTYLEENDWEKILLTRNIKWRIPYKKHLKLQDEARNKNIDLEELVIMYLNNII